MIRFLNAELNIKQDAEFRSEEQDSYAERIAPRQYAIHLAKTWDMPDLIHELWHIYMNCLSCFDNGSISPKDLEKDIYAYSFERLVRDSLQEIGNQK